MQSKIEGRNYIILLESEKKPIKINRATADKTLERLGNALGEANEIIASAAKDNPELHKLIAACLSGERINDIVNGESKAIAETKQKIGWEAISLQTRNDEIPSEEEMMTLEDMGFMRHVGDDNLWEKTISCDKMCEIVEEILLDGVPSRRLKTVYWDENSPKKKMVKKIEYKNVAIGKRLRKIVENTIATSYLQKQSIKRV